MDFAAFDVRHYPVVEVAEGYADWAPTYEDTVLDLMDIRLLEQLVTVDWTAGRILDLACGTGRIGAWMKRRGAAHLDGVDLTPQMLARARQKAVYDDLSQAPVTRTGKPDGAYDLAIQVLADEHLPDLVPLFAEVARVTRPGAAFVLAGYHPHFMLNGIPTHFDRAPGQPVTIRTYLHLFSHQFSAARKNGWRLDEYLEGVIDDAWVALKPKWARYLHRPVSYAAVWRKMDGSA